MRLLSFLGAALVATAPALAQEAVPLTPSHEDLAAASSLSYESQTYDVRTVSPDASIGSVTQTVTDDGEYVVIVTDTNVPQLGQTSRDSVRILRESLAPDYVVTTAGNGNVASATFDALRVVGSYGPTGRTLPIDLELKEPAFHASNDPIANGAALVARALPFREGYVGTFSTFSPTRRLREVALAVTGREDVTRMDGTTVSAWTVDESSEPGGSTQRTYYIDPDTRDLLKITFSTRGTDAVIVPADPEAMAAEAAALASLPQVAPGDDVLMANPVTGYEKDFALQLLQPQEMDLGTAVRRVTVDKEAGTITIVNVLNITMQGQTQTDSLVAAYPSLAPISQVLSGGGARIELTYGEDSITGTRELPGQDASDVMVSLEDGPVFSASALGDVIRALPLEEGYRARLLAYSPGSDSVTPFTIEVTGQDEEMMGWTVATMPENAPPITYVIAPDSHEFLKMTLQPQLGVVVDLVPQE